MHTLKGSWGRISFTLILNEKIALFHWSSDFTNSLRPLDIQMDLPGRCVCETMKIAFDSTLVFRKMETSRYA